MADSAQTHRLVGRDPQLALLRRLQESAKSGAGSVVLLGGEAGTGKSRLVFEFCAALASAETRYAVGQCLEYVQSPFAPWLAALATLNDADPAVLKASPSVRATLSHLLPELAATAVPAEPATDKLRQFNAIVEALRDFGAARPTVVVIEDIHWADSASFELLQHLAANIGDARLLVVATYRNDELKRAQALRPMLAKLARQSAVRRIELPALSASEMHELVFHVLEGRAQLPAATIGAICSRAEGNALFAEELLKSVLESGRLEAPSLPATLSEAVLEHFAALTVVEKKIISHAAVIGRRFQAALLAEIVGLPLEDVTAALKHAVELSLIAEESNGVVFFAFRHELTRQAIYEELLASEARQIHTKIATTLEGHPHDENTAELAYHWWQAHERARAARYNELAADAALKVFAYRDAATALERAIESTSGDDAHRAALNLKLAYALHQCGAEEQAKRAAGEALSFYEASGDRVSAARTCLELARMHGTYGHTDESFALTQHALELVGDDPASPAYFDAHVQMMRLFTEFRWDPQRLAQHMALADAATGARAPETRINFLVLRAVSDAGAGEVDRALEDTRAAAALAAETGDFRSAVRCWGSFGISMLQAGESAQAAAGFDAASEIIRHKGVGGLTAIWIRVASAHAKRVSGDLAGARALLKEALAANVETPGFQMFIASAGIRVGLMLDDDALVTRCARRELVSFALSSGNSRMIGSTAAFAELDAAHGRTDQAASLLRDAIGALENIGAPPGFGDADELCIAAAAYGAIEDLPRARALLQGAARAPEMPRATRANLAFFDAYAANRAGDAATASARALETAELFRTMAWPYHEARALEIAGNPEQALELYARAGAMRDVQRLNAQLNPVNRRGRTKGELTPREREICDLLVQGKTNKAIAEQLVLSERTVESHVSSVLTKMSAATRAELIAKLKG
ncbi:MAG TPA: AAA family ATPase [Candidatus Eremiobacteraceae bacterium]|nr:AAA family ATPase [Candidatus Eremiobacteraceae bacterium]